jgi:redox-sensing transcriptional repressor
MAPTRKKAPAGDGRRPRPKAIGRLSLYRRLLRDLFAREADHVFSHQLADAAGASAAQVRRDMMLLGYSGCPQRGYEVGALVRSIDQCLDARGTERAALVGVGNLGKALLGRFAGGSPKIEIAAAFDSNPRVVNRTIGGCLVHGMEQLPAVVRKLRIRVAIVAVPASKAQEVADACAAAGIPGILNFAPIPIKAPEGTYVSHVDLTMALETVAFFARRVRQSTSTLSGT